jgi:ABC-type nickel/cobalt efflux system permease component RcnA
VTLAVLAALLLWPAGAPAHPLGNFSINRYSALRVGTDTIDVRYIVDMAEIAAFQEIQASGLIPEPDHPSVRSFAQVKARALAERLMLVVNGRRVPLNTVSESVLFPPGAGGLPTLKLGILYRARLDAGSTVRIEYRDANYAERAGWKEIVAVGGPGRRIVETSVPAEDRSAELTDYPTDLLSSPPQTVEANLAAIPQALASPKPRAPMSGDAAAPRDVSRQRAAPARVPPQKERPVAAGTTMDERVGSEPFTVGPNRQAARGDAFTDLVATKQLGVGIVLFALVVAAGLGAFHALEPGHGKTVVAAYLVGARGTAWHALLLGLIVTVSHTAGVYLLGGVTLYAQRHVMPERLYPWIGLLSGLTVAGLGFFLFLRRYTGHDTHHHEHSETDHDGDEHGHEHGDGVHTHAHHHHHHHVPPPGEVTLKELFALGVTGGIVPCPAALVVLLSALSLGRLAFGLVLITAFSVGLAAVLILIGLLMVYARHAMARFQGEGPLITRWLPLASSAIMAVLGMWIAVRALTTGGVLHIPLL